MTAQSSNPSLEIAITEIVNTFKANLFKPKLVLYFGSAQYPQKDLAQIMYKQLHEQFECDCIGASSETEYFDGELKHKSIVAMGFARGLEDYFIKVVSMKTKDIAFSAIEQEISSHFNTPFADLAPDKYFGLILDDFHTQNQDYFIRNLKQLTKITFVGGCASDKSELAQHFVHYNGEIPSDSCIITILKPSFKFKFEKNAFTCSNRHNVNSY